MTIWSFRWAGVWKNDRFEMAGWFFYNARYLVGAYSLYYMKTFPRTPLHSNEAEA
jgi:hypothetical protein